MNMSNASPVTLDRWLPSWKAAQTAQTVTTGYYVCSRRVRSSSDLQTSSSNTYRAMRSSLKPRRSSPPMNSRPISKLKPVFLVLVTGLVFGCNVGTPAETDEAEPSAISNSAPVNAPETEATEKL